MMKTTGWFSLCEQMKGYNFQVTNAFVNNYRDYVVDFQTLVFTIDEVTITKAIGIPSEGEKWLKMPLFEFDINNFLLSGFERLY